MVAVMRRDTENRLYPDILGGAADEGWLFFRVRDSDEGRQPFDLSGVAPGGRAAGVEVKVLRPHPAEIVTLDQLDLRANQRNWLCAYSRQGAYALVLCYRGKHDDLQVVRVVTRHAGATELNFPDVVGTLVRGESGCFIGWAALWHQLRQP